MSLPCLSLHKVFSGLFAVFPVLGRILANYWQSLICLLALWATLHFSELCINGIIRYIFLPPFSPSYFLFLSFNLQHWLPSPEWCWDRKSRYPTYFWLGEKMFSILFMAVHFSLFLFKKFLFSHCFLRNFSFPGSYLTFLLIFFFVIYLEITCSMQTHSRNLKILPLFSDFITLLFMNTLEIWALSNLLIPILWCGIWWIFSSLNLEGCILCGSNNVHQFWLVYTAFQSELFLTSILGNYWKVLW